MEEPTGKAHRIYNHPFLAATYCFYTYFIDQKQSLVNLIQRRLGYVEEHVDVTDTCHSGPSGSDAKMDLEVPEFLGGGNSCERGGRETLRQQYRAVHMPVKGKGKGKGSSLSKQVAMT